MALINCTDCGRKIQNFSTNKTVSSEKNNSLAVGGFITGIISLFLNFWGIVGIVAVILSGVGLLQINSTGEKGKGLAIAGIIIGAYSIFYALSIILAYI